MNGLLLFIEMKQIKKNLEKKSKLPTQKKLISSSTNSQYFFMKIVSDQRNLQKPVPKIVQTFHCTVWFNHSNCSRKLFKFKAEGRKFAKITVGQNNFGNKIPFLRVCWFLAKHLVLDTSLFWAKKPKILLVSKHQ